MLRLVQSPAANRLPTAQASDPSAPKVILGVAASDSHVVANHLIAMLLRDCGYEVINLGVCTPVAEFMQAYQTHRDTLAIIIGSLNGHAAEDLSDLARQKMLYQVRCPVILGGNLSVGSQKQGDLETRFGRLGVDLILKGPEDILPILSGLQEFVRCGPMTATAN